MNRGITEPKTAKCPLAHFFPPGLLHMKYNSLKNTAKCFLLLLNDSNGGLSTTAFTFTV